jgi:hypothetical protein
LSSFNIKLTTVTQCIPLWVHDVTSQLSIWDSLRVTSYIPLWANDVTSHVSIWYSLRVTYYIPLWANDVTSHVSIWYSLRVTSYIPLWANDVTSHVSETAEMSSLARDAITKMHLTPHLRPTALYDYGIDIHSRECLCQLSPPELYIIRMLFL